MLGYCQAYDGKRSSHKIRFQANGPHERLQGGFIRTGYCHKEVRREAPLQRGLAQRGTTTAWFEACLSLHGALELPGVTSAGTALFSGTQRLTKQVTVRLRTKEGLERTLVGRILCRHLGYISRALRWIHSRVAWTPDGEQEMISRRVGLVVVMSYALRVGNARASCLACAGRSRKLRVQS